MQKRLLLVILTMLLVLTSTTVTAQAKEKEIEQADNVSTHKVKINLPEKSNKTYKKRISKKVVSKKVGKLKKGYYVDTRNEKTTTVIIYEQYYSGKSYMYLITKTIETEKTIYWISGKKNLSPKIKKKVGKGVSNAFSKRGWTVKYNVYDNSSSLNTFNKKINFYDDASLIRQIGQFISVINNNFSYQKRFQKVFKEEKANYFGADSLKAVSNSDNYFSYCYELYINEPSRMKNFLPRSYIAIDDCVKKINEKYWKR